MKDNHSVLITLIVVLTVTAILLALIGLKISSSINIGYLLGIWILIVSIIFTMRMRKKK